MTHPITLTTGSDAALLDGRDARTTVEFHAHAQAALRFPGHYGHNWDAFEECLRDVERPVSIGHVDVLLDAEPPRALAVLVDVLRSWAGAARQPVELSAPSDAIDVARTRLQEAGLTDEELAPTG